MKYNLSLKLEVKTLSGASMSMPYLILQFVTPNSQHPVFDVNIDYPSNEDTDFFGTKPIWDILYIGIEGIEKVPKDIQVTLLYKNSPGGIAN